MDEKSVTRTTLTFVIFLTILCAFLAWFLWGCKKAGTEHQKNDPLEQKSDIGQDKEGVVTLDAEAQKRGGITAASLKAVLHTQKIRAFGIVLQLQELTNLRNNYIHAKTQVEKASTNLDFLKKEYERLKALNEDNKNVSDKVLQAAWVALQNGQGNLRASEEALDSLKDTAGQQWGSVIAQWLIKGSPALQRLLRQKEVLVQLTLPAGARLNGMPQNISIMPGDRRVVPAVFISLSPRTDPHIQGTSLFYAAPCTAGNLLTGMNVTADLSLGPAAKGVFIPTSSVVFWQGRQWVYVRRGEEHFVRREISVDIPVSSGYFSTKNFRPGEQIVVKGAQVLLSEESRPKAAAGEEDED